MPIHLSGLPAEIPFYHRDPFDRLIIAQSECEGTPILSGDEVFDSYRIERYWAESG